MPPAIRSSEMLPLAIAVIGAVALAGACTSARTCSDQCATVGASQCVGAQVQICGQGSSGCLEWGAAQACPAGQGCVAAQNSCVTCAPATSCRPAGATQCAGTQVQTCSTDATGCLTWGAPSACAGTETCDAPQGKCASCTSSCPGAGATQCSGNQVQHCLAGAQGCFSWGAPGPCPFGQFCDSSQNGCVDACSPEGVQASCTQAAESLQVCCSGGFAIPTPAYICEFLVDAGLDPGPGCDSLASDSCATLHANGLQSVSPFPRPTCCCPSLQFCDLSTPDWACVPSCRAGSECPAAAPNCVPSVTDAGVIGAATMICSAGQALLWRACDATSLCCPAGSDCIEDANSNQYCAPQCSPAQPCGGDPAVACCLSIRSCQNCGAAPCAGTTYCQPCP